VTLPPVAPKPRIAIAPCRKMPDYEESVRRAGGDPWVLDYAADPVNVVVGSCGGLLLPGGADVGPERYGEFRHPSVIDVDSARDEYEIALARAALAVELPMLAICRGLQVLNVAAGGTLVQDIPSQVPGALAHKVPDPQDAIAHRVRVVRGSRLADLMREALTAGYDLDVNSRHHQSPWRVADGFEITAIAPDGVVEALELSEARFCVAVQWHPENFLRTGTFLPLFAGFIESAR
jgi:putative glutamine amidotransferase